MTEQELIAKLSEIDNYDDAVAFLKENGFEEEARSIVDNLEDTGAEELGEAELESVAGGVAYVNIWKFIKRLREKLKSKSGEGSAHSGGNGRHA